MKTKKLDRRVQYTLAALKNALIELLQTEHISKISVITLCNTADVNRSTFYTHFRDQYALLKHITTEVLDNIQNHLRALDIGGGAPFSSDATLSLQVLKRILDYVKENAAVFRALLSDNCDRDIQREVVAMTEIVSETAYNGVEGRTRDYMMLYEISGCISILHKWLDDGTPESTEEISRLILLVLGRTGVH